MPFITAYAISEFDGTWAGLTDTVGNGADGTSTTLDGAAVEFQIFVNDDDPFFDDGSGAESSGARATLDQDVTIDGTLYTAGTVIDLEFVAATTQGPDLMMISIGTTNVAVISTGLVPGTTYDITTVSDLASSTYLYANICFCGGTEILTDQGPKLVEDLKVGDLVLNKSGDYVAVRWIGHRKFNDHAILTYPHLRPVRIAAGSLGNDLPAKDLLVSPQHRIHVSDWRAELLYGFSEFLAPAISLVNDSTIRVAEEIESFEYFHIMFDKHEIISANGQWTESFYPGEMSMNALEEDAKAELFQVFPELETSTGEDYLMAAPCLKPFEAKALH